MRSVHLIAMLALLATAAKADTFSYVSVTADVLEGFHFNPPTRLGCGGDAQGTTSASISFACDFMATDHLGSQEIQVHEYYSGSAEAETGVGPYGIGESLSLSVYGINYPYEPFRMAFALASFSWSQDVIVRGAQGSGYVIATFSGSGLRLMDSFDMTLFNAGFWDDPYYLRFPIPITFGVPYTLSMSGSTEFCDAISEGCPSGQSLFVSDLSFYAGITDDEPMGHLVPGAYLEVVPEISSWLLLATCAIPTVVSRLRQVVAVRGTGGSC
jgi:hypothetical protein